MISPTTDAAASAGNELAQRRTERGPFRMTVCVTLVNGQRYEYPGVFGRSFDAYDHALNRYGLDVSRIEIKDCKPLHAEPDRRGH